MEEVNYRISGTAWITDTNGNEEMIKVVNDSIYATDEYEAIEKWKNISLKEDDVESVEVDFEATRSSAFAKGGTTSYAGGGLVDVDGNPYSSDLKYYQPRLTDEDHDKYDFPSFAVFKSKSLAKEKFPNHEILEFSGDDIEEPMFIDGNYSKGGTTSYAGGGEISNKNIGVAKRLKIKNWYIKNYPTDDLGEEIDSTITFWELWTYISQGYDVYAVLGVTDSLVRERVFEKLSQILDVDYDVIYNEWLSSSTYAKGGRTYLSYDRMSRSPFKSNTKQKLYDMGYTYDYLKGLSSIQAEKLLKQNSYAKGGQVKVGDIVTFRGQGKYEVIEQTPNSRTMFTIKDIDRGSGWDEDRNQYVGVHSEKGWHLGKNEEFGMESEVHKKFLEPITEYAKGGEIKIGDIMEISVPEWKYSAVGGEKTNWIKTKGKVIRFDKMKGGKRNVVFEVKNMSKNPEMLKNKPFLYYGFDEDMFAKGGTTTYAKGGRLQEEKDMKMIGKFAFGMLIGGLFGFIKK